MKKQVFITLSLLIFAFSAKAQITMGSGDEPMSISVLELISTPGSQSGLRLPQLSDGEVTTLTDQINALPDEDSERAKGLMIFNTTVDCTMVWNGDEFKSLCGDLGRASLIVDCGTVTVYPLQPASPPITPTTSVYRQGVSLNDNHYIVVTVNCIKKGIYTITATTGNGYSFVGTGTFLETGNYTIKLEGQGTPVVGSTTGTVDYKDALSFTVNDGDESSTGCSTAKLITVYPAEQVATYTKDCNNTKANGTYAPGSALTGSNSITLALTNVTGGTYSFKAEGNGMTFVRTGTLQTGATSVTLNGSGTPEKAGKITLTITDEILDDENPGYELCDVDITVAYPAMKIMGLGITYYQPAAAQSNSAARNFLLSANNFGTGDLATVKSQGFTLFNGGYTIGAALRTMINNQKPDIIVMGYAYNYYDATTLDVLEEFVNNDGVIIQVAQYACQYYLARRIFGDNNITANAALSAGYYHPFITDGERSANNNNIADNDPIYFGPFSTASGLSGKGWGEDVDDGWAFNNVPSNAIIYSRSTTGNPSAFRHPDKPYIVWGDGGALAGTINDVPGAYYTSTTVFPFMVDKTTMRPTTKSYTGGYVYNSEFFGNIMAWAIEHVYDKRISNTTP